ncbi:hypothetical protein ACTXLW_04330 [Psychrobacter celer]|uniref:hypothetical protein n=1 Tax=Psychrobacter celer TaxID=306572 RepID=UPI003FD07CC3
MPLRPIDAIFVHPKKRLYVVYYRGELWQLPRMRINDNAWQNRKPYTDDSSGLYLSIHQAISDPILAQKLRTLNLPAAVHGSSLSRFEAWWQAHGFKWLKDKLSTGESPLAAHQVKTIDNKPTSPSHYHPAAASKNEDTSAPSRLKTNSPSGNDSAVNTAATTDIFANMLADLAEEVLHQSL